jgi:hypothetical protein
MINPTAKTGGADGDVSYRFSLFQLQLNGRSFV